MPGLARHLRILWVAAVICIAAIVTAGSMVVYVVLTNGDQARRNCLQIEALKTQIREEARFDEPSARDVLKDLGIDPDSPKGQHLLDQARTNAEHTVRRFAPLNC